jgi:hypothetical protein
MESRLNAWDGRRNFDGDSRGLLSPQTQPSGRHLNSPGRKPWVSWKEVNARAKPEQHGGTGKQIPHR